MDITPSRIDGFDRPDRPSALPFLDGLPAQDQERRLDRPVRLETSS